MSRGPPSGVKQARPHRRALLRLAVVGTYRFSYLAVQNISRFFYDALFINRKYYFLRLLMT
jgi:hypothetical protein